MKQSANTIAIRYCQNILYNQYTAPYAFLVHGGGGLITTPSMPTRLLPYKLFLSLKECSITLVQDLSTLEKDWDYRLTFESLNPCTTR